MKKVLSLAIVCLMAVPAVAAVVVDGTVDAAYGLPLAVQTVQTQFGDEDGIDDANGGELDAAYLTIEGGRLFIAISGNLETDSFNKLSLFIDSRAGGENTLAAAPNYDFGDVSSNLGLISFQAGFEADFHVIARAGGGNFEVDIVDRLNGTSSSVLATTGTAALSGDFGVAIGSTSSVLAPNGSGVTGDAVAVDVDFALDNSNSAGVTGGNEAAAPGVAALVTTGAEFSIALSDLGAGPGDTIDIVAGYSNGDYNFWSNQFLGGLTLSDEDSDAGTPDTASNLGADGSGNFVGDASGTALDLREVIPFSITVPIPEPASLALAGLAAIGMLCARRRS